MTRQTWFTSDTHLGHDLVARLRGFTTPADHDEHVVSVWNDHVRPRDVVWHLGDLTLVDVARVGQLLERLHGTKHLILGNHDRAHPSFRGWWNRQTPYLLHFTSVSVHGQLRVAGRRVMASHHPYDGEGSRPGPDRDVEWRLRDVGVPLLHGHTHDADQRATCSQAGTPMLHVGWDAWGAPVPGGAVEQWVRGLPDAGRTDAG